MSVAMFSLVDAVVLRPLPFPRQDSIEVITKVDPLAGTYVEEMAYPELRDLRQNVPDLEYVAVMPTSLYGYARVLETRNGTPVQIESTPVSHDFFRVLGVAPMLGRDFKASDEHVGAPHVVMVSHRVWRDYLGSDPRIVGHMIRLNGQGYTVTGVMGPGVEFPRGAGFWYPLGTDKNVVERRTATFLQAIGRVKRGVSHERVAVEIETLIHRLAQRYPDVYSRSQRAVVTPLPKYWTGSSRVQLWILLGASILLLAAAILSASLLIISGVLGRAPEIATRIALGASSRHILTQLAAEGAFLAIIGGATGLALAEGLIRLIVYCAPTDIPRLTEAALNPASVAFAVAAAVTAAIVCTMLPGLPVARMRVEGVLREGAAHASLSRRSLRMRNLFVLAQTFAAVIMLAAAGLFMLSYRALMSAEVGFGNRDALTVNLQLRGTGLFASSSIDPEKRRAFYSELLARLRAEPGITSAAAVLLRPLQGTIGWERGYEFEFEDGRKREAALPKANYESVTPQYFETVGTPLLKGRDFTEHDSEKSAPVVIVSRNLAKQIEAAGHNAVGQRIRLGGNSEWLTIVGVCGDARYRNVAQEDVSVFLPYRQAGAPTHYVVIRGNRSEQDLGKVVRRVLASMDPSQAVAEDATVGELIDANMARHRFNMRLLLWFAACAAVLAVTGAYGVMAELVAARKREIAIRMALGAPRSRVVRLLASKTLQFVLMGEAFGIGAVVLLYHSILQLLYGVAPYTTSLLGFVVALIASLSFCAVAVPAWIAVDKDRIDLT